jgi:hypothetical protein
LLATALLLFGASSASAWAINAQLNPGSIPENVPISASDLIIIDLYLDADAGLGFLGVALLYDDNGIISYGSPSKNLSTMPSYILLAPGVGTTATTYVIPLVNPPNTWNGINQPGKKQVNVEYLEAALGSTPATGNNIWIGSIVFHVTGPGLAQLDVTLGAEGTIVEAYTNQVASQTAVSGSFTFGVPEPTTAMLIGFGLVGLAMAGRRKD